MSGTVSTALSVGTDLFQQFFGEKIIFSFVAGYVGGWVESIQKSLVLLAQSILTPNHLTHVYNYS
jgi:hypothetical protein